MVASEKKHIFSFCETREFFLKDYAIIVTGVKNNYKFRLYGNFAFKFYHKYSHDFQSNEKIGNIGNFSKK